MSLVLTSSGEKLEITAAVVIPFTVHYADYVAAAPVFTPGVAGGDTINGTKDLLVAPVSGQRVVRTISVHNDSGGSDTITIQMDDGGTNYTIVPVTLADGYTLAYDEDGWKVLNASGAIAQTLSADEYLLRDGSSIGATGAPQDFGSNGIEADVIAESTAATGVTIDGVLIKDDQVDARGLTDIGEMLFTPDDLLLLDFQRWLKNTGDAHSKLIGSRLEQIVHQGALCYVPGRFPDTQALAVEPAGTNHIINSVFGVNVTDGWTNNGMATYERSTAQARFGTASMHLVSDALADDVYSDTVADADGGEDWTAVVWVYLVSGDFQVTIEENNAGWSDKGSQAGGVIGQWARVDLSVELSAGVTDGRVKLEPEATAASEFYIGYVGFHPTAYAPTAIYGDAGPGYAYTGAVHNSTSTRTKTEVNLDSQVDLISGNDTLTIAQWVQMPFDSDATWPGISNVNAIFDARGANDANRYMFAYNNGANDRFETFLNNGYRLYSSGQTFKAGDWIHHAITCDFAGNEHKYYLNGVLADTSTAAMTAATLTDWCIGSEYDGNRYRSGFGFDEFAVFDRVLTAAEIAGLYANQRPLIDEGALETRPTVPGVSAGYWPMLSVACTHTGDANYAETETAAGTMDSRITFAGAWVDGQIQFEAILKNSDAGAVDDANAKLQYYHTASAAWVDVSDSVVAITANTSTPNRVRSAALALPQQEYEYRVVIATPDDAAETVTCYKAGLVASPGSSTLL